MRNQDPSFKTSGFCCGSGQQVVKPAWKTTFKEAVNSVPCMANSGFETGMRQIEQIFPVGMNLTVVGELHGARKAVDGSGAVNVNGVALGIGPPVRYVNANESN